VYQPKEKCRIPAGEVLEFRNLVPAHSEASFHPYVELEESAERRYPCLGSNPFLYRGNFELEFRE
jgi:hypothetical protein